MRVLIAVSSITSISPIPRRSSLCSGNQGHEHAEGKLSKHSV